MAALPSVVSGLSRDRRVHGDVHMTTRVQRHFRDLQRELGDDIIVIYRVPEGTGHAVMSENVPNQTAAIIRNLALQHPKFGPLSEMPEVQNADDGIWMQTEDQPSPIGVRAWCSSQPVWFWFLIGFAITALLLAFL
jgi:hypothetical protein